MRSWGRNGIVGMTLVLAGCAGALGEQFRSVFAEQSATYGLSFCDRPTVREAVIRGADGFYRNDTLMVSKALGADKRRDVLGHEVVHCHQFAYLEDRGRTALSVAYHDLGVQYMRSLDGDRRDVRVSTGGRLDSLMAERLIVEGLAEYIQMDARALPVDSLPARIEDVRTGKDVHRVVYNGGRGLVSDVIERADTSFLAVFKQLLERPPTSIARDSLEAYISSRVAELRTPH